MRPLQLPHNRRVCPPVGTLMNPADESEEQQLSPSASKDQTLRTLSFPNKLWKIVNECRSGAISWTTDGTAVAINYAKFQSDYLENRLDIFKTNNITSFIRQLNLYGFRMVSPQYRVTMGNPERPDLHVFRNDSFIRGRPDMLQAVTRKTGGLRAKMSQKEDGASPGPSSGAKQQNGHVEGAHGGRSQGNAMPRHKHGAARSAVDRQRRDGQVVGALGGPSSRPSGTTMLMVNGTSPDMPGYDYNANYWDSILYSSQESTSDTESSDEEDESSLYSATEEELASPSAESSTSAASEEVVVDYEASDSLVDGLIQRTIERSESAPDSYRSELDLLLDPNQPPSVVLRMFGGEEDLTLPTIEEYLRVDPGIRPVGESSDEECSETSP